MTANERVIDNGDGTSSIVVDEQLLAHTLISLTVADLRGVIIDQLEIEGIHEQAGPISGYDVDAALETAARAAVAAAFAEVTPVQVRTNVTLDDRDASINATIDAALSGSVSARRAAIAALATVDSTPALYNRAVLTEADSEVEAAVALYEQAADRPDAASYYADTLAGAYLRLDDARRLGLQ